MSTLRTPSTRPTAFWVGLGVPLAIVLVAAWQWYRAAHWRLDVASGHDAGPYLGPLALVTLLLGMTAITTFCLALLGMRRTASHALLSRDALVEAFNRGRRWLPAFMVAQTLLVFGGLIGVLLFEIGRAIDQHYVSGNAMKMVMFAGLIVLALLWYGARIIWDTLRVTLRRQDAEPIQIIGQTLSPAQAPQLWSFVQDIARRTEARVPDTVVVGLNEGFFVTEHAVQLANGQRVPEGRVLYLPLPYMSFMERPEVSAVVAHELGHFTGEDTRYGLQFSPIYRSLLNSILAVTNEHADDDDGWRAWITAPASLYGKWFLHSFDEAVHHWSRERELAADAFSSRIAGTAPAALALLRSAVLQEFVDEALAHNQQAPPHLREGVLSRVRRQVAEHGLGDPRNHLDDQQSHPLDTHPTLKQRLDALGVAITPELLVRTRDRRQSSLLAELGLEASTPTPMETP